MGRDDQIPQPPGDDDDDMRDILDGAPTTPPNMHEFLNIDEAAVYLNISADAVKTLVDQRRLFALSGTRLVSNSNMKNLTGISKSKARHAELGT